ncbi:hypothetical protein D3C78_1985800 [compost metagenome]
MADQGRQQQALAAGQIQPDAVDMGVAADVVEGQAAHDGDFALEIGGATPQRT